MTSANLILKKAALFEKLALYGDRKSFLKALAEEELMTPADNTSGLAGNSYYSPPPSIVDNSAPNSAPKSDPRLQKYYNLAYSAKVFIDRIGTANAEIDKQLLTQLAGKYIGVKEELNKAVQYLTSISSSSNEAKTLLNNLQKIIEKGKLNEWKFPAKKPEEVTRPFPGTQGPGTV